MPHNSGAVVTGKVVDREGAIEFPPVAGLIFDMGDVLYDATAWRRWLVQLLARMGFHFEYRALFQIWDDDYLADVHCGRRPYAEAFECFLRDLGLSPGRVDEVQAASHSRKRILEADARPLPEVRATLAQLNEAGVILAVLSDSEHDSSTLRSYLCRLGITTPFSAVVSSIELGRTKPDPMCYHEALRLMRLPASRVAFVGHDGEELEGAARAGLATIAFNFDSDVAADRKIERFSELLDLVSLRRGIGDDLT